MRFLKPRLRVVERKTGTSVQNRSSDSVIGTRLLIYYSHNCEAYRVVCTSYQQRYYESRPDHQDITVYSSGRKCFAMAAGSIDIDAPGKYPIVLSDALLGKPSQESFTSIRCIQYTSSNLVLSDLTISQIIISQMPHPAQH